MVQCKSSTSLQNDDITPAAFWVTNPNNTITNNAVAGGTHFGFWYRMHARPSDVSFDEDICPRKVELGEFRNNVVHSQGWFGIWIFQIWTPMEGSCCWCRDPIAGKMYGLTAWNNEKGAETVGTGAVQFHDFLLVNNDKAGLEMKTMLSAKPFNEERGPMFKDVVIAASPAEAGILDPTPTRRGIIMPMSSGLLVDNAIFINFNETKLATFGVAAVQGFIGSDTGGFTYAVKNLNFVNSPNKVFYRWQHEAIFHDLDGSLSGTVDGKVVPSAGILPPDHCTFNESDFSVGVPGSVCSDQVQLHRFSYNKPEPTALKFRNTTFTNAYGSVVSVFEKKRATHKEGWMAVLVGGEEHVMSFADAKHIVNLSYTGSFYELKARRRSLFS